MRQFTFGVPNEKQVLFLEDTHRHVAYGGARGGGKPVMVQGSVTATEESLREALSELG